MVRNILVVDDDKDLLFCYSLMLQNKDTKVFTSDDSDIAQEIVRTQDIDLAILDYMMPKLRGDQLAERINKINNSVKIIFISGYAEVVESVRMLDFAIHGVFMKPVNPEILVKIVRSDLDSDVNDISQDIPAINVYSSI